MDQNTLVTEKQEAARKFLAEFTKAYPVEVAFWLRNGEGRRLLYVASQLITDENFDLAYGEVHRIDRQLRDSWFDARDVRVINSEHRLAQAALQLQSQYGPDVPGRLFDSYFGGMSVEEVYIYPTPVPAS